MDNVLKILENRLSGFAKPWIATLEPASPLFEKCENEIFLIKSIFSFNVSLIFFWR